MTGQNVHHGTQQSDHKRAKVWELGRRLLDTGTLLSSTVGLAIGVAVGAIGNSREILKLCDWVSLDGLRTFSPVGGANLAMGILKDK